MAPVDLQEYPIETGDPDGEPQELRVSRFSLRVARMHGPMATTPVGALLIYQHLMNGPSQVLTSIPDLAKFSRRASSLLSGVAIALLL